MSEALYLIGTAVVSIFGGTLIALWLLLYTNVSYQRAPKAAIVVRLRSTFSWIRRDAGTEFRLFIGRPEKSEMFILDISDQHMRELAEYIRDLEQRLSSPPTSVSPGGSKNRLQFSLIIGGKEEA